VLPKYPFRLPESVLDKFKACFRRLQNSPAAQTVVIADLKLRLDLLPKRSQWPLKWIYLGNRLVISNTWTIYAVVSNNAKDCWTYYWCTVFMLYFFPVIGDSIYKVRFYK
jgi:hypothetical protein